MTNEEILSIVKLKYPEAELAEDDRIIMGKSQLYGEIDEEITAEVLICIENNKIVHLHLKRVSPVCAAVCRSAIEYKFKNTIELKHILKLDITREDIVNYLEKELHSSYVYADGIGGWELERDVYDNLIVEEYDNSGNFNLSIFEEGEDGYSCSTISIFSANNSNEYWRLYNIINNLIGESNG